MPKLFSNLKLVTTFTAVVVDWALQALRNSCWVLDVAINKECCKRIADEMKIPLFYR
jgi:hypothetical protein